jgi:hypothetical protein
MEEGRENREFDHDYLCELLEQQNGMLIELVGLLTSPITINVSTNGGTAVATSIVLIPGTVQNN